MPMEINPLEYLTSPHQRIYWLFLLSSLMIAFVFLTFHPKQKRVVLSKKLWLHPSSLLDYGYFIFSVLFKVTVILPILMSAKEVALFVNITLLDQYGFVRIDGFSYAQVMALFTFSLFVLSDFTRYWLHRLLHHVPWLWAFHQVHHSAKVLNPLTFYRVHPVESLLFGLRYSLSIGFVTGVFVFLFGSLVGIYDILGANLFAFMFSLLGSNLRHSHIKLGFGNAVERFLTSPLQHQIHHSKNHVNTNFGGFLSIWDYLFGTLTLSKNATNIKFGLEKSQMKNFQSLQGLLFFPFVAIYKQIKSKRFMPYFVAMCKLQRLKQQ
jgi:sterol desaturase/sphingolipid hydroxylase (fatty acid hydroxylase superfamily)